MAFAFGLIHGFGFAGVLQQLELPQQAIGVSLLSFNGGVEVGQATIVAAAFPILGALRRWVPRKSEAMLSATSCIIIGVGGWWLVERVASGIQAGW